MNSSTHLPARLSPVFSKYRRETFLLVLLFVTGFATGSGMAADAEKTFAAVQQQVSAKPGQAGQIVKTTLDALPKGERRRLAAGIFASTLKGLGKPSLSEAVKIFKIVFDASPDSGVALLVAAHEVLQERPRWRRSRRTSASRRTRPAFPSHLAPFLETAVKAALAAGRADLIPYLVAEAVILVPDQRVGLTELAIGLVPEPMRPRILDAIARLGPGGFLGSPALGGTINPGNVGGSVVSPE